MTQQKKPPEPEKTREEINKELIEEFPFIQPRNHYTGRIPDGYDYSYTALDWMPKGWRNKFGIRMCKDIKRSLEKTGSLNKYRIEDIKEKYGALRVYGYGSTVDVENRVLPRYERMSERICGICGEPATKIAIVWIFPLCDKCANSEKPNSYVDINYYYGDT